MLKTLFALLFLLAGMNHFLMPSMYETIMPPYLPWHKELVVISGLAEMGLGILLMIPKTSRFAAWGLIFLLVAVFPANLYLYQHQELFPKIPPYLHLARLPFQGGLIYWAYVYAKLQAGGDPKPPVRPADLTL